ncbi:hypothetical protein P6144_18675 [Sphingomonas sp. HITSZ_GF]|uniref:hypothetical protein n=1 Tax=Sphingomonas sp. HITSZ_GF TaxID=3037247 RepID=UPI00240DFCF7|nr:hypothetical protein [Sphingomonas sp. HITSZ_GF]MDG2535693.1 hypothetical protein [Sphingomonas sp. HITSZ_GF]
MRFTVPLALALAAGAILPAAAQSQAQINVPANVSWLHEGSGLILRSKIAGMPRGTIQDSTRVGLDMMVQYAEGEETAVTLYIYRPALMSVPLWFDRSETQILSRLDVFGTVTPAGPARAFAGPKAATASALRRVYVPGKGPNKSTGLAIIPLGEWLVAVRVSSQSLDPAALDARIDAVIAGIVWPDKIAESPAAVPVAACADALAYDSHAKSMKPDAGQSLLGALIIGVADAGKDKDGKPVPPPLYCREGAATRQYAVYRAAGDTKNSYTLALGDAGRVVTVWPGVSTEKKDVGYQVSFGDLDRRLVYPNFDKLPEPQALIQAVSQLRPVSAVARGSKNVQIFVPK